MASALAPSHGSGVLGRDPRDSCRFWSPHVEKVCTVTQFRLGEGGGGGGRRTENRDHIYIYMDGKPPPPPHELPTLVLYRIPCQNSFSGRSGLKNYRKQTQISRERVSQLMHARREVRILYLLRSTEINLTFQQDVSVNSFRFDVST